MKTECTTPRRPVLRALHPNGREIYLFQPRCKMWSCLSCAYANKLQWQSKVGHGYEVYNAHNIQGWMFVTITSHPKLKTAEQCLFVWTSAWAKLGARMRRKYPGIRYVLLPEHHADGRVHFHMICSHGLDHRWLKDNAPPCGLGFMTESEAITDAMQSIMYVSKYIGKSIQNTKWPQSLKRIRTSQKWPEPPAYETPQSDLELNWTYWLTYEAEGIDYLAHELEIKEKKIVKVVG